MLAWPAFEPVSLGDPFGAEAAASRVRGSSLQESQHLHQPQSFRPAVWASAVGTGVLPLPHRFALSGAKWFAVLELQHALGSRNLGAAYALLCPES